MSTAKDKELLSGRSSQTDVPDLEKGDVHPEKEPAVDTQARIH
jgi:hypothetical protein